MPTGIHDQESVKNLNIRRTWIKEQVAHIKDQYDYQSVGEAFQALVFSLLFDVDYDAILPEEIVDGGQDKQIDIIKIDDDEGRGYAHIYIIQAKNTAGFSSNTLIQMRNGLSWIFERPRSDYHNIGNHAFANKIDEIRQLRIDYGASNIEVSVFFVTTGNTQDLSHEFLQEKKVLMDTYSNLGFSDFSFQEIGALELVEVLNESERAKRQIDVDISIVYDVNRPSLLQYSTRDTRALICTVTGRELARVASEEPRDAIFDLNVRPFYGSRGRVNRDILSTCTSDESFRFWFLNNGVTMTCDRFDLVTDPDDPQVKVYNAQIVNGCQTSATLREALEREELRDDVRVLLRIYATDNSNLTDRITLTTNNQNRITVRDLRANDKVQVDIQRVMLESFGYYYERKNKQYRKFKGERKKRIVPNSKAAQAYLAIVRKKPSIARGYLGKIWSDYYREVFENATVGDLLASYLIYKHCYREARNARRNTSLPRKEIEVEVYGVFHLARICGNLLLDDKWGKENSKTVKAFISQLEDNDELLVNAYTTAFEMLLQIRNEDLEEHPNPTLYFKAGESQKKLAQILSERSASTARA
jgi:hypothetical protein